MSPPNELRPSPLPVRRALRDLGDHLRVWRKLRGLTQGQLAERAGVNRRTIGRMERGDGEVRTEIFLRIAHALGILDRVPRALDPYETDIGRLRADEQLPKRVRPRDLT
jgi:transcriptional regulator with XRE-family HTH domain